MKRLILFGIVLLLLVSFASAADDCSTDYSDYLFYDDGDIRPDGNATSNNTLLTANGYSLVAGTSPSYLDEVVYSGNKSIKLVTATESGVYFDVGSTISAPYTMTWVGYATGDDNEETVGLSTASAGRPNVWNYYYWKATVDEVQWLGFGNDQNNGTHYENQWVNYSVYVNGSHIVAKQNGVIVLTSTMDSNGDWRYFSNSYGGMAGRTAKLYFDDFRVFTGETCPSGGSPTVVSSLNLSSPLPANNTQFNTELLNFNLTANSTYDFNCSIYIDDVLNITETGFSSGTNIAADFNVTFAATEEATHTYLIECWNGINETNTSTNTFHIDNVLPNINFYTPATDNSSLFNLETTPTFNTLIELIDPNLFSYYYNISYTNGTAIYQYNNTSLTGSTEFNITTLINMTGYTGKFVAAVQTCDGHTNEKIKEINNIEKTKDKIKFADGVEDVELTLESNNGDYTITTKLDDRYKFKFKTKTAKSKESFLVKSNEHIYILDGQTEYPGHLVTGHRWVDFARPGIKNVIVTRINSKMVRVEIELWSATTDWEFNSIGELNCREVSKSFNTISEAQNIYSAEVLETSVPSYTLVVNISGLTLNSANANLTWNGSAYASVVTNDSETLNFTTSFPIPFLTNQSENHTFNWLYNINGENYTGTSYTQTVYQLYLDNCSSGSLVGLNYSFINDSSLLPEIATFNIDYNVYLTNSSLFRNYSLAYSGASTYHVCILPNFTNMSFSATGTYQGVGFAEKSYVVTGETINNVTRYITLGLTGGTTPVLFTVVDEVDIPIANVTIQVYIYDPTTGTTTISETVVTDAEGKQFADIVLNERQYKFILLKNGEIILETENVIITTTTKRLRVNLNANYFDNYDVVRNIAHTLTYTNATKTFSFTWNDAAGEIQSACLKLDRQSINSERKINETCTAATSGTINLVIDEDTQDFTYIATSYVKFTDGSKLMLNTISVNYNDTYKKFGLSGIFVAFLLTLTLVMIGVWHPTISVILMILGLVVSVILGIYTISWGALVGLIVMGGIVIYKMNK